MQLLEDFEELPGANRVNPQEQEASRAVCNSE
jgi:hypothetical protein